MIGGTEPITVTIGHRLGRDEAKSRIDRALGSIRGEIAPYVKSLDYEWKGYNLDFRVALLMQRIAGRIEVEDAFVRIEFTLPRLLHLVAKNIAGRIESRGVTLLEGPKKDG